MREKYKEYDKLLKSIIHDVSANNPQNQRFILINGSNDFLKYQFIDEVKKCCKAKGWEVNYPDKTSDLEGLSKQNSLFSPKNLYVVKSVDKQRSFAKDLANIPAEKFQHDLILMTSTIKSISKTIMTQINRLNIYVIDCLPLRFGEYPLFVKNICSGLGIKLSSQAISYFSEYYSDDLQGTVNELKNLHFIFHDEEKAIDLEDIYKYCTRNSRDLVFKIDDLLRNKKFIEAQLLGDSLLERGESVLAIIGILARHCRNAILVRDNLNRNNMEKHSISLPEFVIKSYNQYVRIGSQRRFESALIKCQQADEIMKASRTKKESFLLTEIISELSV